MTSKWDNCAHNDLICFFQHTNLPTFEQWLWDRLWVLSTWFGDICGIRTIFSMFFNYHVRFISNSVHCGCLHQDQLNIAGLRSCSKQKCTGNWAPAPPPYKRTMTNCALWFLPCESPGCRRYFMFLDTLCSKKSYDMPHIGCGFHA